MRRMMTESVDKVALTIRITVNLRPDEYDELKRQSVAWKSGIAVERVAAAL